LLNKSVNEYHLKHISSLKNLRKLVNTLAMPILKVHHQQNPENGNVVLDHKVILKMVISVVLWTPPLVFFTRGMVYLVKSDDIHFVIYVNNISFALIGKQIKTKVD